MFKLFDDADPKIVGELNDSTLARTDQFGSSAPPEAEDEVLVVMGRITIRLLARDIHFES